MSKKGKCKVDYYRKRERQEVKKILVKVKKRIALKYSPCQGQSNLTPWKTATNHGRLQMPAMEDRATQGCDLSASWLPRGRCHTVSLFSVAC